MIEDYEFLYEEYEECLAEVGQLQWWSAAWKAIAKKYRAILVAMHKPVSELMDWYEKEQETVKGLRAEVARLREALEAVRGIAKHGAMWTHGNRLTRQEIVGTVEVALTTPADKPKED